MNLMTNFRVTINKRTQWQVQNKTTGLTKNFWSYKDAEDYLDWQENLRTKTKGDNVQAQKRKA